MGIKSRQRRRQQAAGRASAGNAGVPRGFNPRTGEFDGTGMSQDEILALYEELAAEERRRQRGGRVRYSEGNAVMKLWNGVYRLVAVVALFVRRNELSPVLLVQLIFIVNLFHWLSTRCHSISCSIVVWIVYAAPSRWHRLDVFY